MTLDSVGGVFVVLLAGMGIALATSVLEFLWKGRAKKSKGKQSSMVVKTLANRNSNLFQMGGFKNNSARSFNVVRIC